MVVDLKADAIVGTLSAGILPAVAVLLVVALFTITSEVVKRNF